MKKTKLVTTVLTTLLMGSSAFADITEIKLPVQDRTYNIELNLNVNTVRCLVGDYGASSLKISVPELNEYAVFSHTTRGETLPCINAGPCKTNFSPDRLLDPSMVLDKGGPTENVPVRVLLEEVYYVDAKAKVCERVLTESVTTAVRGLDFHHYKSAPLVRLPYEKCEAILKP